MNQPLSHSNTTSQKEPLCRSAAMVELTRGGIVEVTHRGFACIVSSDGDVLYSKGDIDFKTFLRSSAKPFQAAAVILSGAAEEYRLTDRELAIISGSHGGEPFHTELVTKILAKGQFTVENLLCGTHPPLDEQTRSELIQRGEKPSSLHHNCSGKHSGMLLTAQHKGSPIADYLDPNQPGQRLIKQVIAETAKYPESEIVVGIDGCSAPVHALSIKGIARLFAQLVRPVGLPKELSSALMRVASSMRAYPEMVAASRGRICTELMRFGQGVEITGKAGAEGVYGVGWFDERQGRALGLAIKMEDGQQRGRDPMTIALMQKFGALPTELPEALQSLKAEKLTNWQGKVVGETIVWL